MYNHSNLNYSSSDINLGHSNRVRNKPCKKKACCNNRNNANSSEVKKYISNTIINNPCSKNATTTWRTNYLVSNRDNGAAHVDNSLINPWGIVLYNDQIWVANGGTDTITNYDLFGNKLLGSISIRSASQIASYPTGIAINCTGAFSVTNGTMTRSALLLVASEHSTVNAYNPLIDPLVSNVVFNVWKDGRLGVYKGIAIVNNTMYLADFYHKKVELVNVDYLPIVGPTYQFIDVDTSDPIPSDYGPTNVVHLGCFMFVLWAKQSPNNPIFAQDGPGTGYISIFNLDGSFVRRFASRGVLNNPWALIPAPCEAGFPPHSVLVSNHGDGRINIFDSVGRYVGPLLGQSGLPLTIDGMRGLAPHYSNFNEIYVTAASNDNTDGTIASLVKDQVIHF